MAYTEKNLTRGTIKITDPETGLSEWGPKRDRANIKKRLASKIRNKGTITSDTKLGDDPKPYKRKKKAEVKKKTKAVFPDIDAPTEEEMVAPVKKGVGGGAVMPVKGYVKDTLDKSGIKSIVKSAVKEALRKKQPDDVTTTGVVEKKNIPERYESKIEKMDELGKKDSGGTMFGDVFMGPGEDVQQYPDPEAEAIVSEYERKEASPFVGTGKALEQKEVSAEKLAKLDAIDAKLRREEGERGQIEYGRKTYDQQEAPQDTSGLMKMLEDPKEVKAEQISEEPVRIDDNGYPIYAKGSKKAAEWNAAYDVAKIGKFMWDGREYVKKGEPEEDEKAAIAQAKPGEFPQSEEEAKRTGLPSLDEVTTPERRSEIQPAISPHRKIQDMAPPEYEKEAITQGYDTGDANLLEQSFEGQMDEQSKENFKVTKKIIEIKERTSDYQSRHREIQEVVKPLSKEDTAISKEATGDWYVDPFTGFAIDLNALQKRADRKDAMEMMSLLPANKRAVYMYQEGLIAPEDLDKLLEPSEVELLDKRIKELSLDTATVRLAIAKKEEKYWRSPEELQKLKVKVEDDRRKKEEEKAIRKEVRLSKSGDVLRGKNLITQIEKEERALTERIRQEKVQSEGVLSEEKRALIKDLEIRRRNLAGEIKKEKRDLKTTKAEEVRDLETTKAAEVRKAKVTQTATNLTLFKEAGKFDDYEGQLFFGKLLGLPEKDLKRIINGRMKAEIDDTPAKAKEEFEGRFPFTYEKVLTDRKSFVLTASSVFQESPINFEMGGKTIKSRKGLLDALGLSEYEELMPPADSEEEWSEEDMRKTARFLTGLPDQNIFRNRDYQNDDGSPNYAALMADRQEYQRFLMDNIVYVGMERIYGNEYSEILNFRQRQRKNRMDRNKTLDNKLGG